MKLLGRLRSLVRPADVTYRSTGGVLEEEMWRVTQGQEDSRSGRQSACGPGGGGRSHFDILKKSEKQLRTAATNMLTPKMGCFDWLNLIGPVGVDWYPGFRTLCTLLRICKQISPTVVLIKGLFLPLAGLFFFFLKKAGGRIDKAGSQQFPVQLNISIRESEVPATDCSLYWGVMAARVQHLFQKSSFRTHWKHSFIHLSFFFFQTGRYQFVANRWRLSSHFHPITAKVE